MKISSPERSACSLIQRGQFPGWILNEFCCSGPFLFQQIERKLAAAAGNLPPLCVFGKAAAPRSALLQRAPRPNCLRSQCAPALVGFCLFI